MKQILLVVFPFLSSISYSQVVYKNYLYNLDSLKKPKLFSFTNTKENLKSYIILEAVKVDTGFMLIQKRFSDSFDIDSSIQFIDSKMLGSTFLTEFWYYDDPIKSALCKPETMEASWIDYNTPNNHAYSVSFNPCDASIPIRYREFATYKKKTIIKVNGKKVECIKYKVTAISIDLYNKTHKRKGLVYLGKNTGVIKYTNNSFFKKSTWVLTEITDLQ